ncbi:PREDICTED: protein TIFY 10A-like [Lupinus angustifolius]|uniref:protein TIFY 10A-like n=1 Tax=Lupinus angustifolius TaxID=3871 RepID=UPI00092EF19B|nr:PREDICTED: protein TIFY 10A-like [Lupinus angustifolius]
MSSSSEYSEFSGQKPVKSPEKTSFSHTCSLLSQYMKEKGSFGDLTIEMTCNKEQIESPETSCQSATTMNLFPTKENNIAPKNLTALDLLSPQAAFRPHLPAEEIPTLTNSSVIKPVSKGSKPAQLTIFYAGQVIAFDDVPADKANEIMSFASKGISQSQNYSVQTYTRSQPSFPHNLVRTSADSIAPNVNIIPSTRANSILQHPQPSSRPVVCDLPIARNASLHRFLEKRKDRIAAKAPYQVTNHIEATNKPIESKSWLGLGAKSSQSYEQL